MWDLVTGGNGSSRSGCAILEAMLYSSIDGIFPDKRVIASWEVCRYGQTSSRESHFDLVVSLYCRYLILPISPHYSAKTLLQVLGSTSTSTDLDLRFFAIPRIPINRQHTRSQCPPTSALPPRAAPAPQATSSATSPTSSPATISHPTPKTTTA